jgi:osmotically-inducible protein OsmY
MIADLPTIAPDDQDLDLEAVLNDMLFGMDGLNGTRADVRVEVAGGHVTLRGAVQSPMVAVEVERAVADVPGVTGVTNLLVDDGNLSRVVAEALSTDPRTRDIPPGYRITAIFANIAVAGRFTDAEAQQVMTVAQAVPGVRSVNVKTF